MSTITWFNSYTYAQIIQNLMFARIVNASASDFGYSVTCDSSGNIYFAGSYNTTSAVVLDQEGDTLGTLTDSSGDAAFVCKFDSSGNYQYTRIVDSTTTSDTGYSVSCDSSGNMYFAGSYNGTPTIKDQSGIALATLPASAGGTVAFVCKFNSSGTYQYSRIVDSTGADIGNAVSCDSSDNMYLTGYYNGTPTIKAINSSNVSTNVGTLPASAGSSVAFTCKFDSSGNYQYSRVVDATGADQGLALACDSSGNAYLSGSYTGAPTIKAINSSNVSTNVGTLPTSSSNLAAFVCKFDSTGTYQYSRVVDVSTWGEAGNSVACDSSNNMYLTGYYSLSSPTIKAINSSNVSTNVGTLPNPTGFAAFTCKFNSSGAYQYSLVIDSSGTDIGYSVICDSSANMYMAGYYTGTPTISNVNTSNVATSLGTLPASSGGSTAFASKFNSSGAYQYTRILESNGTGNDYVQSVECDSSNNLFIAGYRTGANQETYIEDQTGTELSYLPTLTTQSAFLVKFDSSGNYTPTPNPISSNTFSRVIDSANASDFGYSVTCDSSGNMYLAGLYWAAGTPAIKDQSGNTIGTLPIVSGGNAAFVSKFNSKGSYQYSRILDSAGADVGFSVACDSSGNIYIAGYYTGTPTIANQAGTSLGTLPASVGAGSAAFLSKFNKYGVYQYSRIVDSSTTSDQGLGVTCDSSGNVYFSGYYQGTPTIKNQAGGSLGTLPASAGGFTAFVCKFDSSGNYQYSRIVDSSSNEVGYSVACDSSSNMYMSGYYQGTPSIKNQSGTTLATLPVSLGSTAAFVCKFNSSGTYQYTRIVDSSGAGGAEQGLAVACDSSANMYFAGYYNGTPFIRYATISNVFSNVATLPAATGSANFVSKFDSTGAYQYSCVVDSGGADQDGYVTCDSSANMYLCGYYTGTPTIKVVDTSNVSTNVGTLPASLASNSAAFVSKFDSTGAYQYSRIVDSLGTDSAYSVACDSSNNLYIAGSYTGTPAIKDQSGTFLGALPTSSGTLSTAFVCKFDSSGNYSQFSYQYPPAALSATSGTPVSTTLSTQPYGNGTYTASSGPNLLAGFGPSMVFDRVTASNANLWTIALQSYNSSTGNYDTALAAGVTGGVQTTAGVNGEWVQLQLPVSIVLTSYTLTGRETASSAQNPRSWVLFGSNNGSSWTQVDSESGVTSWSGQNFGTVSYSLTTNTTSYNYYRIVITANQGSAGVALAEMALFGY